MRYKIYAKRTQMPICILSTQTYQPKRDTKTNLMSMITVVKQYHETQCKETK
jgi:hypothetical protein